MPELEGTLVVTYLVGIQSDDATPDNALEKLETAYEYGELGVLDSHDWLDIELDGEVIYRSPEEKLVGLVRQLIEGERDQSEGRSFQDWGDVIDALADAVGLERVAREDWGSDG